MSTGPRSSATKGLSRGSLNCMLPPWWHHHQVGSPGVPHPSYGVATWAWHDPQSRSPLYAGDSTEYGKPVNGWPYCPRQTQRWTSMPEAGQYDSADQDMEEDDLASELDFDSEKYNTEATDPSGQSTMAKWCRKRNRAMHRERAGAKQGLKRSSPPVEEIGTSSSQCSGDMTVMTASPTGTDGLRLSQPWQRGTRPNE